MTFNTEYNILYLPSLPTPIPPQIYGKMGQTMVQFKNLSDLAQQLETPTIVSVLHMSTHPLSILVKENTLSVILCV